MVSHEQIMEALSQVIDPERGINGVDLGLLYNVDVRDGQVHITMPMTAPGCPLVSHLTA